MSHVAGALLQPDRQRIIQFVDSYGAWIGMGDELLRTVMTEVLGACSEVEFEAFGEC